MEEHLKDKVTDEAGEIDKNRLLAPHRLDDETHEEYAFRRKQVQKILKRYKKGRLLHASKNIYQVMMGEAGSTYKKEDDRKYGEESSNIEQELQSATDRGTEESKGDNL